jgi:hypothetical protein
MATLPLALINDNPPDYLSADKIRILADLMKNGVRLKEISVYRDGDRWAIYHGFHRFAAHKALGRTEIEVDVVPAMIPPGARSGRPLR